MRRTATAITAGLVLLSLTGCGPSNSVEEAASKTPSDVTVSPSTEETPTEEATRDPEKPYALTDTVSYEGGVTVSLTKFSRGTSSEWASPENTPYIRFTVKITNESADVVDATSLSVNCQYGDEGLESEAIFDSEKGLKGSPSTRLLAGRSISVPWGCELPKDQTYIQIEVAPDMESETAILTGHMK